MNRNTWIGFLAGNLLLATTFPGLCAMATAQTDSGAQQTVSSGQMITPLAPTGAIFSRLNPGLKDFPSYTVGQAVKTVISPDGDTLLILTSGYNRLNLQGKRAPADSNEYVFVFDVTHGALRQTQVLQVPNTFIGLAFAPDGKQFYVSGGVDDDIHVFSETTASGLRVAARWRLATLRVSASTRNLPSQTWP